MKHANRYRPSSQVERKGFDDGYATKPRLFDVGFDQRYDRAFNAGQAVAAWERRSAAASDAKAA